MQFSKKKISKSDAYGYAVVIVFILACISAAVNVANPSLNEITNYLKTVGVGFINFGYVLMNLGRWWITIALVIMIFPLCYYGMEESFKQMNQEIKQELEDKAMSNAVFLGQEKTCTHCHAFYGAYHLYSCCFSGKVLEHDC